MAQVIEEPEECTEIKNNQNKTVNRFSRQSFRSTNRTVTDGYWCFLFLFIFIIWYASLHYAIHHHRTESKIDSNNIETTKNASQLASYYLWGKNWFFDAVTCNLAFINAHHDSSGSMVIWANLLLSVGLFIYSISTIPNNHAQIDISCLALLGFSFMYRFFIAIANDPSPTSLVALSPYQEKLSFWLMPEIMVITIWYTRRRYTSDHQRLDRSDEMLILNKLGTLIMLFVQLLSPIYFYMYVRATNSVYQLNRHSPLLYVIVGGSCYIGLTIFYFFMIATSCAVDMAIDYAHDDQFFTTISEFFYAVVIVARYHFGTACYHATLIFPRLHSLLIMNESEFKNMPKMARFADRFYVTHCKLHNITLMSTAVGGTNHKESLKELLRHYASDFLPKLELFKCFSCSTGSLFMLLISTNSLMIITLWAYGANDPRLQLATWTFYLRLMILFSAVMKLIDIALDTILLHAAYPSFTHYFDSLTQWLETNTT